MTTQSELTTTDTGTLVVWDVDGTLTRSDTLLPFLRLLVGSAQWVKVMTQAARETATHGASRNYLKAYLLQRCLAGREHAEVLAMAQAFANDMETHRCRTDAIRRWSWHHARGDREKARQVKDVIDATCPEAVWVYSDSRSDTPSFDLADITTRVRPWSFIPPLPPAVQHLHTTPGKDTR